MKRKVTSIVVLGVFLTILSRGDVYVALNGPGPAPFLSWATASPDIQSAVTQAAPNDTIFISNGVYVLNATLALSQSLALRGVPAGAPSPGTGLLEVVSILPVLELCHEPFLFIMHRGTVAGGLYRIRALT